MTFTPKQKDALMRVLWTTLQVAVPSIAVYLAKLPPEWIPVGTVVLAVIKNLVAAHYQPTSKDPA